MMDGRHLPSPARPPATSRPVPPEVTATNNKKSSQFAAKTPTDKLLCISQGRDHGPGAASHRRVIDPKHLVCVRMDAALQFELGPAIPAEMVMVAVDKS